MDLRTTKTNVRPPYAYKRVHPSISQHIQNTQSNKAQDASAPSPTPHLSASPPLPYVNNAQQTPVCPESPVYRHCIQNKDLLPFYTGVTLSVVELEREKAWSYLIHVYIMMIRKLVI